MPKAEPKRQIKVFIASPSDLAVERRAFRDAIDLLNLGFGDGAGVEFTALGWEDTLAVVRSRSQGAINQDIDTCDIFVLVMHRRWGQPAPDATPYSSYTEEEFHRALARYRGSGGSALGINTPAMKASQPGYAGSSEIAGSLSSTATHSPTSGGAGVPPAISSSPRSPEIFVFFKHIDPASMADPGPQLTQVLKFRRELEDKRIVLYRNFADEKEFVKELDRHLRAYVHGDLPKADAPLEKLPLPLDLLKQVEEERAATQRRVEEAEAAASKARDAIGAAEQRAKAADARANALALTIAERAANAALDGRIEEARQDFATVVVGTTSLQVLFLAYQFYDRTSDLVAAETMLQRWLSVSGPDAESSNTAAAIGILAMIEESRGNLDAAEKYLHQVLAINVKLGHAEDVAITLALLNNNVIVLMLPRRITKTHWRSTKASDLCREQQQTTVTSP